MSHSVPKFYIVVDLDPALSFFKMVNGFCIYDVWGWTGIGLDILICFLKRQTVLAMLVCEVMQRTISSILLIFRKNVVLPLFCWCKRWNRDWTHQNFWAPPVSTLLLGAGGVYSAIPVWFLEFFCLRRFWFWNFSSGLPRVPLFFGVVFFFFAVLIFQYDLASICGVNLFGYGMCKIFLRWKWMVCSGSDCSLRKSAVFWWRVLSG